MRTPFYLVVLTILVTAIATGQEEPRFVVFEHGRHGYISQTGTVVISPSLQGTYVIRFSEGLAAFAEGRPEKWGFINSSGEVVIKPQFDSPTHFSEGLAPVFNAEPKKWSYIDKNGKMRIEPRFRRAENFSEGFAAVQNDNLKWGYTDQTGRLVIPFQFDGASDFHDGRAAVQIKGLWGYIDSTGQFAAKAQFTLAYDFSEGLAKVRIGGKTGYIVLGPAGGQWSFIDKDGKIVIEMPKNEEQPGNFSEGLASFQVRKHDGFLYCGYMDKSGRTAIEADFTHCEAFSEGLAVVYKDMEWTYIDHSGSVALRVDHYTSVDSFKDGLAPVTVGGGEPEQRFGYINKQGQEVWPPRPAL